MSRNHQLQILLYALFLCTILFICIHLIKTTRDKQHYLACQKQPLELDHVLLVIKTSSQNHNTRIKNIVDTWYKFAKNQVYLFNDKAYYKFESVKYNLYMDRSTRLQMLSMKIQINYLVDTLDRHFSFLLF